MAKINKKWVIFSLVFWLFCCQGLFVLVQKSAGEKTVDSIQNQLRQELNFSDFHFLARSISDFTRSGAIKCAVLEKIDPDFIAVIDLRYMERSCNSTPLLLEGSYFDVPLKTLNGDTYQLRFISNNSRFFGMALWGFRIIGIILVLFIIITFSLKAQKDLIKFQLELDFANKLNDMSLQVSHDIRSPLAALKMATEEVQNIDHQSKKIIQMAIGRIDEIANDLLRRNVATEESELKKERLYPILKSIVIEKQIEFKNNRNIEIEFKCNDNLQNILATINQIELKRIISNLINNSIESFSVRGPLGRVVVRFDLNGANTALITIKDTGKGIPKEVVKRLGERGFSFGKENSNFSGSGLGIHHAKNCIEKNGGKFEIESILGIGTTIKIFLPCMSELSNESLSESFYDAVLLDNDELVRLTWQARAKKKDVQLLVIESPDEFDNYKNKISKTETSIYIDCELGENVIKGEEFAQKLYNSEYRKLILATGHSKENFSHLPWLECIGKSCPF